MNKARLRQEYTVSGSILTDLAYGIGIGLGAFLILVMLLAW
jgi:hypothetical protein